MTTFRIGHKTIFGALLVLLGLTWYAVAQHVRAAEALARADAKQEEVDSAVAESDRRLVQATEDRRLRDSVDAWAAEEVARERARRRELQQVAAEAALRSDSLTVELRASVPVELVATVDSLEAAHEREKDALRGEIETVAAQLRVRESQLMAVTRENETNAAGWAAERRARLTLQEQVDLLRDAAQPGFLDQLQGAAPIVGGALLAGFVAGAAAG